MTSRVLVVGLLASLFAATAIAQEPTVQPILIPVFAPEPVPGANGSSWTTELWLSNFGDSPVAVSGVAWDCQIPECGFEPARIEPGVTVKAQLQAAEGGLRGILLAVDSSAADRLGIGLRVRDLSRQASTWGTELPAPREDRFRSARFSLVDVPVGPGFRHAIRIYELDGSPRQASVRVRVYRLDTAHGQPSDPPDALLGEATIPLEFVPPVGARPDHPGYAQITDLASIATLGDAERLRLEIEPASPGLRLWAFATVTHNETQHATMITPQ